MPQETVLDPFMGSGTTALAAKRLGRNSIGYEINPEFIPLIKEKIGGDDVFNKVDVSVIRAKAGIPPYDEAIKNLPYQFIDAHKIDKKIDVKKLQYGSKIDAESNGKREEYFTVKGIISPELIRLNNDLIIRLRNKTKPCNQRQSHRISTRKTEREAGFSAA